MRADSPTTNAEARRAIALRARMRMLFRQAVQRVDAVAQSEGLSPAQYHVLLALAARMDENGVPESDLVRHLEASRAHVSVLVRGLEGAGLVSGRRDREDRRQLRLEVTDVGWALLDRLGRRQEDALRDFVGGLDGTEIRTIVEEISSRYLGLTGAAR